MPQFTVVMATYNHFKGTNLKWPKIIIVRLLSFDLSFFNQSSAVTRKVLCSKLPPVAREFSGGGALALGLNFERDCEKTPAFFDHGGRLY